MNSSFRRAGVLVHGGAGTWRRVLSEPHLEVEYRKALRSAAIEGYEAMKSGSALEAVIEAVKYLEDSGLFNAGKGAVFNLRGYVELDAGVMYGKGLEVGAVAAVSRVKNPVVLAGYVMKLTDHVLLVGKAAEELAKRIGLDFVSEDYFKDPRKIRRFQDVKELFIRGELKYLKRNRELYNQGMFSDTVGAVALDEEGNLAAATSTGGIWLKMPGRIGDSPIPGAGFYADNEVGAVSATGIGEVIMRTCLCYMVYTLMKQGTDPLSSCSKAIEEVTRRLGEGTAGVIAIDKMGRVGYGFNTEGLARAYMGEIGGPFVAIFRDEKLSPRLGC
ncbi:MAG: asparaginase [Thermoprotei archaeon]|nr:MAG: asparaginase [Thermoprotei archaeon]RLF24913.1 MAG: asparaginase [Thermoprotei archaeon]